MAFHLENSNNEVSLISALEQNTIQHGYNCQCKIFTINLSVSVLKGKYCCAPLDLMYQMLKRKLTQTPFSMQQTEKSQITTACMFTELKHTARGSSGIAMMNFLLMHTE